MHAIFKNSLLSSIPALKFATKATLAALISLYIAFLLDLDQPHWAATTALIVAQPQAGMVLSKGLARLVGTLIGTALSIVIMGAFAQMPMLFLLAIAAVLMLSVTASTIIRSAWSYGFVMIGITVAVILIPNIESPTSIFNYATSRCFEISLGIVISSIIFAVLWPIETHKMLIQDANKTIHLGFSSAIKSMKGEALDDTFLQSLSNIIAVDTQREHAAFEGQKGKNSAQAILGMCQNILNVLSLARSINRDKQTLSPDEWQIIAPWIHQTIDALEQGKRSNINQVLIALHPILQQKHDQSINITLHRIYLLLRHALRARRFLHSARKGRPIRLVNESSLSQHRNYTLGILFGLRSALAFMTVAMIWLAAGWSLINAIMPLIIGAIICSLFAGRENAERISLIFFNGSVYAVIIGLIINIYILPEANGFIMLSLALGIPIFVCSMMALIPKYFVYASLPISFLMLIHPDNHLLFSTEFMLNQSIGLLLGTAIAAVSIHLIPINMPYWHGKTMKKLILRDLTRLIHRPLHNSNTWFNARMADRLILLARHKDIIEKHAKYRWQNAILALDLGDEIFFLRRILKYYPQLSPTSTEYFKILSIALQNEAITEHLEKLELATQSFNMQISQIALPHKADILQTATVQIYQIWLTWCQLTMKEELNGNS
ncbi:FUSC family protein [Wohlfahrtiimonas larvae]|uniref:FUSC family protein n=1 Tax=Wohlfahrtiimonas larvae TaxID=1157986 RepID=A0ABP9MKH7_9GAMM|nr:FUSC family protein [Wohlfahrtiimonas larvae]